MTWRDDQGSVLPSIDTGIDGFSVIHEMIFTVDSSHDLIAVECETNFGSLDPAPGDNEATNVPSYSHTVEFDPVIVHCKYSNISCCWFNTFFMRFCLKLYASFCIY